MGGNFPSSGEVEEVMAKFDTDQGGTLDFREFLTWWQEDDTDNTNENLLQPPGPPPGAPKRGPPEVS